MLELIMSSFLGVFTVSIITLLGAVVLSMVNLIRKVMKKDPIVDNSTVSALGYAAILIIVAEVVIVFVLF